MKIRPEVVLELLVGAALTLYTGHGVSQKVNRIAQALERSAAADERRADADERSHPPRRHPSVIHLDRVDETHWRERELKPIPEPDPCVQTAAGPTAADARWECTAPAFHARVNIRKYTLPTLGGTAADR